MLLSTDQVAPALRIVSEWLCLETQSSSSSYSLELLGIDKNDKDQIHHEILRLITRSFPDLKSILKCHGVHFASKSRLLFHKLGKSSSNAILYCEQILAMGRVDIDKDVRDRSRYESHILHMVVGLKVDPENITSLPPTDTQKITVENATSILLKSKPSSSWIPIEKEVSESGKNNLFRFGTLSSMISHKAGMKYAPLPPWAGENSPKSLRDPPPVEKIERRKITNQNKIKDGWNVDKRKPASDGFYDSDESSSESSSASSDEESSSSDDSSSYSSESSDSDSSSSEDESSDSDDSDDDDTDESVRKDVIQNTTTNTGNLLDIGNMKSTSQKVGRNRY
jgi:AP-3 complex subunit beta